MAPSVLQRLSYDNFYLHFPHRKLAKCYKNHYLVTYIAYFGTMFCNITKWYATCHHISSGFDVTTSRMMSYHKKEISIPVN